MNYILLLIAVVIWGSTFVATKICLEHMSTLQLVASRFLIAAPMLYLFARLRKASFGYSALARPLTIGAGIFSVHFLIQTWALEFTTATNSGWIVAVTPLTIAIMAVLVLKEAVPPAMRAGLVVATLGIVLLVSRGELTSLDWLSSVGDWLMLLSTGTWALYTILTRDLSRARDPVVIAFAMTLPLAAAALVLPFALDDWTPLRALPPDALFALFFLGLGGVALAQWFWQTGVAQLGAAKAGLFLYLEPLTTTALAVPLLGAPFGPIGALGGLLVLAGVFVAQRSTSPTSIVPKRHDGVDARGLEGGDAAGNGGRNREP